VCQRVNLRRGAAGDAVLLATGLAIAMGKCIIIDQLHVLNFTAQAIGQGEEFGDIRDARPVAPLSLLYLRRANSEGGESVLTVL
jgi:hypothetical protein